MSDAVESVMARATARVGATLRGKWRLEALIGVGGMAAVYQATHRNGMRGAVKILHLELSLTTDTRDRFLREGYAANRVDHRGVVRVLDDDVADDGSVFLVMELLEGQTVDALAASREGGVLGLGETLAMADQLLDILAAAHDKGVVHRDLKPENLFFTNDGEVKVLDFGIARLKELGARATTTGVTMGTPAFMPPEQASGRWSLVDARTDLWAVGATMFTLLTGQYVHEAATVQLLLAAAMTQPARSIRALAPNIPREVGDVVDCALAFDPATRWANAHAMRAALRSAAAAIAPDALAARIAPATAPAMAAATPAAEGPTLAAASGATLSAVASASRSSRGARGLGALVLLAGLGALAAIALASVIWVIARSGGEAPASARAVSTADSRPPTVSPSSAAAATAVVAPAGSPAASVKAPATDESIAAPSPFPGAVSAASPASRPRLQAPPRPKPPAPPKPRYEGIQ